MYFWTFPQDFWKRFIFCSFFRKFIKILHMGSLIKRFQKCLRRWRCHGHRFNSVNVSCVTTLTSWSTKKSAMANLVEKIASFFSYWYFRYTLVTELYIVDKWERNFISILWFAKFAPNNAFINNFLQFSLTRVQTLFLYACLWCSSPSTTESLYQPWNRCCNWNTKNCDNWTNVNMAIN